MVIDRLFDRFAPQFGSVSWAEVPDATKQTVLAVMAQAGAEQREADAILTTEQMAARLKLKADTVARMCHDGELAGAFKPGNHWRMYESDFRRAVGGMIEVMGKRVQRRGNGHGGTVVRLPDG